MSTAWQKQDHAHRYFRCSQDVGHSDDTVIFPYEFICSYPPDALGGATVSVNITNLLPYRSEKHVTFELHQPINGLVMALSEGGQPIDFVRVGDVIDLRVEVEDGSHMDVVIDYGDGSPPVTMETNGTCHPPIFFLSQCPNTSTSLSS